MILNASVKLGLKVAGIITLVSFSHTTLSYELSGYTAAEYRFFQHESPYVEPGRHDASIVLAPEFYYQWDDGQQSLIISPFLRVDSEDDERTHADLRELQWLITDEDWELRLGIAKVFWGVAESQHLVDVINQTDFVENNDTEDKLGQPMINLSLFKEWGTLDFFVLPHFRERTFAGEQGRFRGPLVIDTDAASYESSAGRQHIDAAVRWSHSIDDWDLGVSHFYGTNREPLLRPNARWDKLIPFYEIMHQTGIDIQYTDESWLWKLEMIRRETSTDTVLALTGGFEYTFFGVFETDIDVGLIAEYLFDDRDNAALAAFEDDILMGTRITWNDVQSTELLVGAIHDLSSENMSWNIEGSRRIGDRWKISLEGRFFGSKQPQGVLFAIRDDDYVQLELARYF